MLYFCKTKQYTNEIYNFRKNRHTGEPHLRRLYVIRLGVSMTVVSLAWQYAKGVAAPIVGTTNPEHFKDATKAVDLQLTDEDIAFLEEPYRAHEIVGALDKSLSLEGVMPKR